MRYLSDRLALVAVIAPSRDPGARMRRRRRTVIPTSPTKIEEPVLRFDVVDIPGKGQIVSVAAVLSAGHAAAGPMLRRGETVENDARLRLPCEQ